MSTIVTRASKGSALTYAEMDANFNNLNTDKLEAGTSATNIANTPSGNIVATNVQSAINELDTEKLPVNATSLNGTTIPANETLVVTTDISSTIMPWVAPGTSGNILTSNGSIWTSATPSSTLPSQTGNAGTSLITNGTTASWRSSINLGTSVASTSGTSIDFTGIPSWVNRITLNLIGVSTNGTSNWLIQLGTSGGVETTGYLGACSQLGSSSVNTSNYTAGAGLKIAAAAATMHGSIFITRLSGNNWVIAGMLGGSDSSFGLVTYSSKGLSTILDRIRLTTVNGTDTFDAGSINITWE